MENKNDDLDELGISQKDFMFRHFVFCVGNFAQL